MQGRTGAMEKRKELSRVCIQKAYIREGSENNNLVHFS